MRVPALCATRTPADPARQQPFSRVAPVVAAALLLGAGVGFVFAAVLSITEATRTAGGTWWTALVQAHGHVQLYGWAGLLVIGVALHFLPRLRGAGLARPALVPWLLGALAGAMLLRALCQPLTALTGAALWRAGLALSGILECAGVAMVIYLLITTSRQAEPMRNRPALRSVFPYVAMAFASLAVASLANLVNVARAATLPAAAIPNAGDDLNVTLGLLGFLVPMTLAMSARSLPMYAGLNAFPVRTLWPTAFIYLAGLLLAAIGVGTGNQVGTWSGVLAGIGFALIGATLIVVVVLFVRLMRSRGRLPEHVAGLAPSPTAAAGRYAAQVRVERGAYGPFVALIASAFTWALLGGVLLVVDGASEAAGRAPLVTLDAARHSLAVGYIALLICGIAPRMLPGFSGGRIRSPHLVTATLWLGNSAALLRVGSLLIAPALDGLGAGGQLVDQVAFGLSGPLGLALALCLLVNIWPALWPRLTITVTPRAARRRADADQASIRSRSGLSTTTCP
jgi:uncharacterized protein involved in response to NO